MAEFEQVSPDAYIRPIFALTVFHEQDKMWGDLVGPSERKKC